MPSIDEHERRVREALIRERRRRLWRNLAALVIGGAVVALLIAGALTWMGPSVSRPPRNPRRAYEKYGTEIPPATAGSSVRSAPTQAWSSATPAATA